MGQWQGVVEVKCWWLVHSEMFWRVGWAIGLGNYEAQSVRQKVLSVREWE